ncbi:bifunctional 2-polyprenyl-6-hydroxyphenol methylase/3-demethylubiquinol 3-O-methyltransferase UbiG [Aliikangiella sp. G2MR2-5]|uniref:class I SAM-dependent methyltransferase n=1 Tax=Aliikangiella sp. G2MR2-5 TaxID=2788943 RepID=UPI0018AB4B71|nr:methyltransferase domain-containing protein [Aliikangiella sp. G2MR2-5]
MLKQLTSSLIQKVSSSKPQVKELDQKAWDELYDKGKWDYLDSLSELAHYSVILGYAQYVINHQSGALGSAENLPGHAEAYGKILDVGCGQGVLQQRLSVLPYQYYCGIDIAGKAIEKAQSFANEKTEFVVADASSFNNDTCYDLIIFNESLYCFNDCIAIIRHYQKMLKKDGYIVISMHEQPVSQAHWKSIEQNYQLLDSVTLTNRQGVSWRCGLLSLND